MCSMDTDAKVMDRRKAFFYAQLFILLSLALFFSRSLFTDRIPATADILQTCTFFQKKGLPAAIQNRGILDLDNVDQFIPWFRFNTESIKSGSLPLWNPHEACGQPHIANMQSAFFFPLNFLIPLFGMKWGLLLIYLMRLYLCGTFVYLYLSEIAIDYKVSILVAVAGMFTGYNTRWLYQANSALAFFLPLGLFAVEYIVRHRDSIKGYFLACLGFTMAIFAGHPETLFYGTTIILLYALIRIGKEFKGVAGVRTFAKLAGFLLIGLFISGIQLVPFIEYLFHSTAYLARPAQGNPPLIFLSSLLFSLVQNFLSTLFNIKTGYVVFYALYPLSSLGYTGITMVLLFVAGIAGLRQVRGNIVYSYLIIMMYLIIVSMHIPFLHHWILMLPGFKLSWTYFAFGDLSLFVIFLGAFALDAYLHNKLGLKYFSYAFIATLVMLIVFFAFFVVKMDHDIGQSPVNRFLLTLPTAVDTAGTIVFLIISALAIKYINRPAVLIFSLGALVFIETALPMIPRESAIKPAYFYPENNITQFLQKEPKPFRIEPLFETDNNEVGPPWPIGIVQYYGLEEPGSYDAILVNRYSQLIRTMPADDFANLANIKFFIMTQAAVPQFRKLDLKPLLSYNGYTLYENLSAYNRAFMVYDYKTVPNSRDWLNLVREYGRRLSETAIIREKDAIDASFTPYQGTKAFSDVRFEVYKPSFIEMEVDTTEPGLLVISNTYFPGWKVIVDGVEKKLIRTDYAFDGVFLEKGVHTVVLAYKPLSFLIGLIVTITGIIILVFFILASARKKGIA